MSNTCNCVESCTPCEMHGFCHLCETERLTKERDSWQWQAEAQKRLVAVLNARLGKEQARSRRWKALARKLWVRCGVLARPWK